MRKKIVRPILCAVFLMLRSPTVALAAEKMTKIGYLSAVSVSADSSRVAAFRQGLRDLGYVEGKNMMIEYRYADGKLDQLPGFVGELIGLKVDVLVTIASNATLAAKNATRTIPIVFLGVTDPIGAGFVDSLARPGGNITGFTNVAAVLVGKRLELLKETLPKLARVAVLWNPQNPGSVPQWKESQLPAQNLKLQLHSMEVSSADRFEVAFKDAIQARSAALYVTQDVVTNSNQKQIATLAAKNRLPAIYARADYADNGGLMSYGPAPGADGRDAARHVDKILNGAKPGDLPVEQPKKFELIVNLKAAKQIGLTIPPNVLARADRVIK
jgi:putative ABC transport system substrate-binding protein